MGEYSLGDLLKSVFETLVKIVSCTGNNKFAFCKIISVYSSQNGCLNIPEGYTDSQLLMNAVTFDDIKNKVERAEYTSAHALLLDFKWLQHNLEILYRCKLIHDHDFHVGSY